MILKQFLDDFPMKDGSDGCRGTRDAISPWVGAMPVLDAGDASGFAHMQRSGSGT